MIRAGTLNLQQLETELDAFLADYQRLPLLGASEHLHERKQRFLDRVKSFALQAATGQLAAARPQPEEAAASRGRPPKNTDAEVIRVALQLESEGKRVTGSKLRSILGGGRVDRYAAIWSDYVSQRAQTEKVEPSTHPVAEVIARQRLENESAEEVPRIVALDSTLSVGTKLYSARPALPN